MQDQLNIENNQLKQQAVVTAIYEYNTNPNVMKCLIEDEDYDDCGY